MIAIAVILMTISIAYISFIVGYHSGYRVGHLDGYDKGIYTADKIVDELIETNGLEIKKGR